MRTISTPRLRLRPWVTSDVDPLLALYSQPAVTRFLGERSRSMHTRADALASIARRRGVDHRIHGIWALTLIDDDVPVGNLLLKPLPLSEGVAHNAQTDIEIGWHLHPDVWGRGFATEAARAVVDDAFGRGTLRILAVTHPDNLASQAVCRRLGMTPRGRTDRYYDTETELFEIGTRSAAP